MATSAAVCVSLSSLQASSIRAAHLGGRDASWEVSKHVMGGRDVSLGGK